MTAKLLYETGFTALVSVVPPNAIISPDSKIKDKDRGKVPGQLRASGMWSGYKWREVNPTVEQAMIWEGQGANIGLRAAEFPAFDIDVLDPEISNKIRAVIERVLGETVVRHGRRPKQLLMYRASAPMKAFRHKYEHPILGETHLVEFLSEGYQYVVQGTHPVTMKPYELEDPIGVFGLLGSDGLPLIDTGRVEAAFVAIDELMAELGFELVSTSGSGDLAANVDQDGLNAPDGDELMELVSQIPNDLASRDEWIEFCYAIRGASQNDPGAGLQAWLEWCSRWEYGNDPDLAEHEWNKAKGPYRLGYSWLLDKARQYGVATGSFEFGEAETAPEGFTPGTSAPKEGGSTDPELEASKAALRAREPGAAHYTEAWLAAEFVRRFGEDYIRLTEIKAEEAFYKWEDGQWRPVRSLGEDIQNFFNIVAEEVLFTIEKASKRDPILAKLGSRKTVNAVISYVAEKSAIQRSANDMDTDPDVINTPAGAYCLRTGEKIVNPKSLYLTRSTRVVPDFDMVPTRWLTFIEEVTNGNQQLAHYLKVMAGYWLTGRTESQVFPFFQGRGANGKSKFIGTIVKIMGSDGGSLLPGYSAGASRDLVQTSKNGIKSGDVKPELARLRGARLVTTDETETSARWDEQIIKQITGGDMVSARFLYGKAFNYVPSYKLVVIGNYAPDLSGIGPAILRRLHVVPWKFNALKIAGGPDEDLQEKLDAELPGIFAWMIEGAQEWYRNGLPNVPAIEEETDAYMEGQDTIGEWMGECVEADERFEDFVTSKEVFESYQAWCGMNYHKPPSYRSFAKVVAFRLQEVGAEYARTSNGRGYKGIRVVRPSEFIPDNVTPIRSKR